MQVNKDTDGNKLLAEHFQVDGSRGAPMGRKNCIEDEEAEVILFEIEFHDGDYDAGGAYWGGGGQPMYAIIGAGDEGVFEYYLRSPDARTALQEVHHRYPKLKFLQVPKLAATNEILAQAGFWAYCIEYADVQEEKGGSFKHGIAYDRQVERLNDDMYVQIMRKFEKELSEAWGMPAIAVFSLMGLETIDQLADAFYTVLMRCAGHGLALSDQYDNQLDEYESVYGALNQTPIHTDKLMVEFEELARSCWPKQDSDWCIYRWDTTQGRNILLDDGYRSKKHAENMLQERFDPNKDRVERSKEIRDSLCLRFLTYGFIEQTYDPITDKWISAEFVVDDPDRVRSNHPYVDYADDPIDEKKLIKFDPPEVEVIIKVKQ